MSKKTTSTKRAKSSSTKAEQTATQRKRSKAKTEEVQIAPVASSDAAAPKKTSRRSKNRPSFIPEYPYPALIDEDQLAQFPKAVFSGKIQVIDSPELAKEAVKELRKARFLGIDTETRPRFTAGERSEVSLLQVATEEVCYLFRLPLIGSLRPLLQVLEDETTLKIGLSLRDDLSALKRLVGLQAGRKSFEPQAFIELQKLCLGYGIQAQSLQKIYAIVFGERISKSQRMSNWEAPVLTPFQCEYAALDAWAPLRIYQKLMSLPAPAPDHFSFII